MNKLIRLMQSLVARISDAVKSFSTRDSFQPAACNNILGLLLHLCDLDENMRTWILRWIAFQMRNPGAKMRTALVINGNHFSKSLFFEDILTSLFPTDSRVITTDELHDKFTRWAVAPCSMVVVRGTYHARHVARMRAFVTAESVIVERRGQAPEVKPNHLNFVFLSTYSDFLPSDLGGRRFVVLEMPPAWPRHFHAAVRDEINQGGISAFMEYLMLGLDLGDFNESTQPPQPKIHRAKEAA
jgi:putative DNA primase/helicase